MKLKPREAKKYVAMALHGNLSERHGDRQAEDVTMSTPTWTKLRVIYLSLMLHIYLGCAGGYSSSGEMQI